MNCFGALKRNELAWFAEWMDCNVNGLQCEWIAMWMDCNVNGLQCEWIAMWMDCNVNGRVIFLSTHKTNDRSIWVMLGIEQGPPCSSSCDGFWDSDLYWVQSESDVLFFSLAPNQERKSSFLGVILRRTQLMVHPYNRHNLNHVR